MKNVTSIFIALILVAVIAKVAFSLNELQQIKNQGMAITP